MGLGVTIPVRGESFEGILPVGVARYFIDNFRLHRLRAAYTGERP